MVIRVPSAIHVREKHCSCTIYNIAHAFLKVANNSDRSAKINMNVIYSIDMTLCFSYPSRDVAY